MESKTCKRCNQSKPTTQFSRASREKDGLQDRCKECNKAYAASYRAAHPEKERQRHAEYHVANKSKINKRISDWQKKNRDKVRAKSRKHYYAHKESEAVRAKEWRDANSERHRNNAAIWRSNNADHCKTYDDQYWRNNKPVIYAKTARRRAAKLKATVSWADKARIAAIYAECVALTVETGVQYHVDHIVPLVSKIVCGLHCEANLQIITGSENLKKHNSRWPDMP